MCPKKDLFSTSDSVEGRVALVGNNVVWKIIGRGIVWIKIQDDVLRTLTNVRCIPKLNKNLISLGTLDSLGWKYINESGVLKVSWGAFVVIKVRKS